MDSNDQVCDDAPLVSIIIPAYNAKGTISECVGSLLKQTYSPIEIIIVDDGSNDGSSTLLDSIANNHTNVKVFHQPNGGPNSARNRGISEARGEYLVFVDADDNFYSDDTLTLNMELFSEGVDIVSFPQYRESFTNDGTLQLQTKKEQFNRQTITNKRDMLVNWFNGRLIDGGFPGKIFRKTLFNDLKLNEEIRFTEDHYNIPDLVERCQALVLSGLGGYVYKYNPSSAIHSEYTPFKRYGQFRSELRLYEYLREFKGVDNYKNHFYFRALANAYYLMDTEYEIPMLRNAKTLNTIRFRGTNRAFHKLLSILCFIFGLKNGLKITHFVIHSIYRR